jgi:hypothetical protein
LFLRLKVNACPCFQQAVEGGRLMAPIIDCF